MTPTQTGDKPMVTLELLPCPFCGGEAERFTIGDDEPNNAGGDVITCTKCQASSHVEFGRKENLVDRWNTRHREQEIREQPLDTIQRLGQEFDAPEASPSPVTGEALREALADLATAEAEYRKLHDLHGDSDMRTGRAWDRMRRKGDAARAALSRSQSPSDVGGER